MLSDSYEESTTYSSMPTGSSEATTTGNVAPYIKPEFYTPEGPLTVADLFRDIEGAEEEMARRPAPNRNRPFHQNKSLLLMPVF